MKIVSLPGRTHVLLSPRKGAPPGFEYAHIGRGDLLRARCDCCPRRASQWIVFEGNGSHVWSRWIIRCHGHRLRKVHGNGVLVDRRELRVRDVMEE